MEFMLAKWEEQKGEARELKTSSSGQAKTREKARRCYFKRFISSKEDMKIVLWQKIYCFPSSVDEKLFNMRGAELSNEFSSFSWRISLIPASAVAFLCCLHLAEREKLSPFAIFRLLHKANLGQWQLIIYFFSPLSSQELSIPCSWRRHRALLISVFCSLLPHPKRSVCSPNGKTEFKLITFGWWRCLDYVVFSLGMVHENVSLSHCV